MSGDWHPGDFKRICDRTGFAVRASQTTKQWNGLIVDKKVAEPRHPQEFVRGRADKQSVPDARPRQVEEFVGPLATLTTAAAVAGAQLLNVESSVRFGPGDHLGVMLASGEVFRAVLMTVPGLTQIELASPLPDAVATGSIVTNYSAVAVAEVS